MLLKKKKTRTPEQVQKRFKFTFYLLMFMVGLLIIGAVGSAVRDLSNRDGERRLTITDTLDVMLDTIIRNHYGPEAYVVKTDKCEMYDVPTAFQKQQKYLENVCEAYLGEEEGLSDTESKVDINAYREELNRMRADTTTARWIPCYVRRVKYNDGNGYNYLAIQQTPKDLSYSTLFYMINLDERGRMKQIDDALEIMKLRLEQLTED